MEIYRFVLKMFRKKKNKSSWNGVIAGFLLKLATVKSAFADMFNMLTCIWLKQIHNWHKHIKSKFKRQYQFHEQHLGVFFLFSHTAIGCFSFQCSLRHCLTLNLQNKLPFTITKSIYWNMSCVPKKTYKSETILKWWCSYKCWQNVTLNTEGLGLAMRHEVLLLICFICSCLFFKLRHDGYIINVDIWG